MQRPALLATLAFALLVTVSPAVSAQPQPTNFSFASDDNHDGPTFFLFAPTSLDDGAGVSLDGDVNVDLVVDLNDDVNGGLVTFQSTLDFDAELYDYQIVPWGADWVHQWRARGTIYLSHLDGAAASLILRIGFDNALVTSWSADPTTLGQTVTIQDGEKIDPGILFSAGPFLTGLDVFNSTLAKGESFAFTLTNVRDAGTLKHFPKIDTTGKFLDKWIAEGSFSASGNH